MFFFTNTTPQSVVNLIGPVRSNGSTSTSSDMVTQLFVYGVSLFPSINLPKDRVASVARQVSLALVGAIILSSLRQLMSGVKRVCVVLCISGTRADIHNRFSFQVLRVTNRNLGASMMLLLLAQIMVRPVCIYVVEGHLVTPLRAFISFLR